MLQNECCAPRDKAIYQALYIVGNERVYIYDKMGKDGSHRTMNDR